MDYTRVDPPEGFRLLRPEMQDTSLPEGFTMIRGEEEDKELIYQKPDIATQARMNAMEDVVGEESMRPAQFIANPAQALGEQFARKTGLEQFLSSTTGGFYGGASRHAEAASKGAEAIGKLLGTEKEGGAFKNLADRWKYLSEYGKARGTKGLLGKVEEGVGQAGFDVPSIMAFGPQGLTVHGGLMGAAEGGLPGAGVGAATGALTHKILGAINILPSKARVPAFTGFGAATTPGGIEDRTAGALTWAALGLPGGDRKVTVSEFLDSYPKIKHRVEEKWVSKLTKGKVSLSEIKEAGGARKVLDELYKDMRNQEPEQVMRMESKELLEAEKTGDAVSPPVTETEIEKAVENPDAVEYKYTGVPGQVEGPRTARDISRIITDWMQIEPRFRRIDAPRTGETAKMIEGRIDAGTRRARREIKEISDMKLSDEDYQKATFVSANFSGEVGADPIARKRFSPVYQKVRSILETYRNRLKEQGIPADWPDDMKPKLQSYIEDLNHSIGKAKTPELKESLTKRRDDIQKKIGYLEKFHPKYVPIPRFWIESWFDKDPDRAVGILTEMFHERETVNIRGLAEKLIDENVITKRDTDIRQVLAAYAVTAERKIAIAKFLNEAKGEGLVKDPSEAPQYFQYASPSKYPTLKGEKVHPVLLHYLEQQLLPRIKPQSATVKGNPALESMVDAWHSMMGVIKMAQFYMPWMLPMYDVVQAWWSGSVRTPKMFKNLAKGFKGAIGESEGLTAGVLKKSFKSLGERDKEYQLAEDFGAFSTPFSPGFKRFVNQIKEDVSKKTPWAFVKKAASMPYRVLWDSAWFGDHTIRMMTYHHYRDKGLSPRESAQMTARIHGDYASIPPKTRRILNKIFFTPSFKIAMTSAQLEMFNSAGKLVSNAVKGGTDKVDFRTKAMAKASVGLLTGIAMREGIMKLLGFKSDFFGLKYHKEITDDETGEKKDVVVYTASPDNVILRYAYKFRGSPIGQDDLSTLLDRAKWDLHPMWRVMQEILSNKSSDFKPIYDMEFDSKEAIFLKTTKYMLKEFVAVSELMEGEGKEKEVLQAEKMLMKDIGKMTEIVLRMFSLQYTRSPMDKRVEYRVNALKRLFSEYVRAHPDMTDEQVEKKYQVLQEKIKKARKILGE